MKGEKPTRHAGDNTRKIEKTEEKRQKERDGKRNSGGKGDKGRSSFDNEKDKSSEQEPRTNRVRRNGQVLELRGGLKKDRRKANGC